MPSFVILGGLPGSGKSTVAAGLKNQHGYFVVSTDLLRLALNAGVYPKEDSGDYGQLEPVVWELAEIAVRRLLGIGADVAIDATNLTKERRMRWQQIARSAAPDVRVRIRWCVGAFDSPQRWAAERGHSGDQYRAIRKKLEATVEPPDADEADEVLVE